MMQKLVASTRRFIGELATRTTAALPSIKTQLVNAARAHAKVLRAIAYVQSVALVAWWHLEDILDTLQDGGWLAGTIIAVAVGANLAFESPMVLRKAAILFAAIAVMFQIAADRSIKVAAAFRRLFGEDDD